ncbi:MAG: carbon-nitrogen family hydrolase [Desulfobacula sp.]|nr:carbon-nitrogen family hydrolase [Desulfobacula sp.]
MVKITKIRIKKITGKTNILNNEMNTAVIQFDVKKGEIQANLDTVFFYLKKLAANNVRLAVLPEMFSCSFDNDNLKEHAGQTDRIIKQLARFAAKNNMAIAGTLPEQKGEHIYNTMSFIDTDGKVKANYRKLHLFRLTGEHLYYTAGEKTKVIDTTLGRIGLMTCYDLRFPELARSLFLQGARIIVVSAQWPSPRKNHWKTLVRARAIENQLFMVCSNRTGVENGLSFPGVSVIVDPLGNIIADANEFEGTAFTNIKIEMVDEFRTLIPCMSDRREEIYG